MKKPSFTFLMLFLIFGMMMLVNIPRFSTATTEDVVFSYPEDDGIVAYDFYDSGLFFATWGLNISTQADITRNFQSIPTLYTQVNASEFKWNDTLNTWTPETPGVFELGGANDSLNFYVCNMYGANLLHTRGIDGIGLNESYYPSHYPNEDYFGTTFDTTEVGSNWIRYTNTDPSYYGMFYLEVRPDGWVQNFTLIDNCAATTLMYIYNETKSDSYPVGYAPNPVVTLGEKTCLNVSIYVNGSECLDGVDSLTVNWGDSSSDDFTEISTEVLLHTYSAAGSYDITITIVDDDGDSKTSSPLQVTVSVCDNDDGDGTGGDDSDNPDGNGDPSGLEPWMIVLIIGSVVVIGGVLFVIKKKKNPEEKQ